jgi:hypothetical protein
LHHTLDRQGHGATANAIRDTVQFGSTATEILMTLRWQLRKVMDEKSCADTLTNKRIERLVGELDKVLS